MTSRVVHTAAWILVSSVGLLAQGQIGGQSDTSPFRGSVPPVPATSEVLPLSLVEAIDRALKYNLGLMNLQDEAGKARGIRLQELADLLPNVDARLMASDQKINLAAFGFSGNAFPGISTVVGPFPVFDARLSVSQSILNLSAMNEQRRETHNVAAADYEARSARDFVVLVAADLYLNAVAAGSRIDAVKAQVDTAQALYTLASDQQRSGIAPQIDVLRAQVELESQKQRLIVAENDFTKQKMQLARAIGLVVAQPFELTDKVPYSAMPAMTVDDALTRALASRTDYMAARARVEAAEADHRAAVTEAVPSVVLNGDYGTIGPTIRSAQPTFTIIGAVKIPVFDGGRRQGRERETDAVLRERRSEADDFRQRIELEVRSAYVDVQAAEAQVRVAQGLVELANAQLVQAQDRFRAGVTSNLEVTQAQEAVAAAAESRIASLYAHNAAKASLAHAMGLAEQMATTILRGAR
jgi:outer membrane protein TolC